MEPLVLSEIVDRDRYAVVRDAYRSAVIGYKRSRRMAVGENVTLLFEDRETLRFQVQEMLWVEGITSPQATQYELDTYNELVPKEGELSATLFIEITEASEIRPALDRLIGVDEHVALVVGEGADSVEVRATFDAKQLEEDRISAVQYIKFRLPDAVRRRFCDPSVRARLRIDHPHYAREDEIPDAVRESLIAGLVGAPVSLVPEDIANTEPARDRILFEDERVRARVPARPAAIGHVIVEPVEPVASLLVADAEIVTALLEAVRRVVADLAGEHGAARVHTDVGERENCLRWHVYAHPR